LKSIIILQAEEFNGLALLLANTDQFRGDISAAFIRPSLPNSIYIEAHSPLVIQCYLGWFSSSISWHKGVHLVPLQERVQLLSMHSGKLGDNVPPRPWVCTPRRQLEIPGTVVGGTSHHLQIGNTQISSQQTFKDTATTPHTLGHQSGLDC
jgi:hypothetical protein